MRRATELNIHGSVLFYHVMGKRDFIHQTPVESNNGFSKAYQPHSIMFRGALESAWLCGRASQTMGQANK